MIALCLITMTAVLTVAGLWIRLCAVAAVLAAAATLVVGSGNTLLALGAGFAATGYLIVTHTDRSTATWAQLQVGLMGAGIFGLVAAAACAGTAHLPWMPILMPLAALLAAVVPLRSIRASRSAPEDRRGLMPER